MDMWEDHTHSSAIQHLLNKAVAALVRNSDEWCDTQLQSYYAMLA